MKCAARFGDGVIDESHWSSDEQARAVFTSASEVTKQLITLATGTMALTGSLASAKPPTAQAIMAPNVTHC